MPAPTDSTGVRNSRGPDVRGRWDGQVMALARMLAAALAIVFVLAAVTKLRRPQATASELAELGLVWPAGLARVVPAIEVALAVALVLIPAWGGIGSFAALAAFTTVLIGVIRSGRVVSCSCFGGLSSRPVSPATLGRNGVLMVSAALVAAFA